MQATQKQLAQERLVRQQAQRETETNAFLVQRKDQEVELLKALMAKLQKYGREIEDYSINFTPGGSKREQKTNLKREQVKYFWKKIDSISCARRSAIFLQELSRPEKQTRKYKL